MNRNMKCRIVAVACVLLAGAWATAQARIIYVDPVATGARDGSSWIDAYGYLQDALADANNAQQPTEIRVAQGVYRPDRSSAHPDGTGDRAATFLLFDGVAIRGGFAGISAQESNARDIARYETVLSGDLAGDDIPVVDPRDLLTEPTRAENSYTVVRAISCSRSAVLDGVTIRSGNALGSERNVFSQCGAGLLLRGSDGPCCPSIRNCTVRGNAASRGAGARVSTSQPEFVDCLFADNAAAYKGGGLQAGRNAPTYCEFTIRGCVFTGNSAQDIGGAIDVAAGPPIIEDCTFAKNFARAGGAIYIHVNTDIANCRFVNNAADEVGGAIALRAARLDVASCTCVGNVAPHGRACYAVGPYVASLAITNSIFWNGGDEIGIAEGSSVCVEYSDIHGGWPGEGNINIDPLFADPGYWDANGTPDDPNDDVWVDGEYHLKSQAGRWDPAGESWVIDEVTSPCIDAGDPYSPIGLEPFPNGGRINMGAYGGTAEASKSYFGEPLCETIIAGDINGDCKVDLTDLVILVDHWTDAVPPDVGVADSRDR